MASSPATFACTKSPGRSPAACSPATAMRKTRPTCPTRRKQMEMMVAMTKPAGAEPGSSMTTGAGVSAALADHSSVGQPTGTTAGQTADLGKAGHLSVGVLNVGKTGSVGNVLPPAKDGSCTAGSCSGSLGSGKRLKGAAHRQIKVGIMDDEGGQGEYSTVRGSKRRWPSGRRRPKTCSAAPRASERASERASRAPTRVPDT